MLGKMFFHCVWFQIQFQCSHVWSSCSIVTNMRHILVSRFAYLELHLLNLNIKVIPVQLHSGCQSRIPAIGRRT